MLRSLIPAPSSLNKKLSSIVTKIEIAYTNQKRNTSRNKRPGSAARFLAKLTLVYYNVDKTFYT